MKVVNLILSMFFLTSISHTYAKSNFVDEKDLDNRIYIGAPRIKKTKIIIQKFYTLEKNLILSDSELNEFSHRMRNILDFTNWFEFINTNSIPALKEDLPQSILISKWKSTRAEYVITGKATSGKGSKRFNLELRLFDIKMQKQVVGKMYTNLVDTKTADIALRRFGDVAVGTLTGTPGPFMSQIAFVGKKSVDSPGQIYIADFDGGNLKQITNNDAVNLSPNWSKDGTKIIYTSYKSNKPEIYIYNLLTKQETRAISGTGNSSGGSFSPDGNTIAFSASTNKGTTHIFSTNKFGGNKKPFISTSDIEVEPSFSPDGRSIAFTSAKFGKPMIFIKDLNTGNILRLTYAGWYNANANWSPDSKIIVFASFDREIDRWDLFKINSDATGLERLTLNQGDNEKPSFSPDGRFILFQSDRKPNGGRSGTPKLYYMKEDGTNQKNIPFNLAEVSQPVWSPRIEHFETD